MKCQFRAFSDVKVVTFHRTVMLKYILWYQRLDYSHQKPMRHEQGMKKVITAVKSENIHIVTRKIDYSYLFSISIYTYITTCCYAFQVQNKG